MIRLGTAAAVALGGLHIVEALWNPVVGTPLAVVFFCAAWALHRRRASGGYGGATFLAACLLGAGIGSVIGSVTAWPLLGLLALLCSVPASLMYLAGRSLRNESNPWSRGWLALAAATFVGLLLFRPYVFPTPSMSGTVLQGDHVLVQQAAFGAPGRGDLVVFRRPGAEQSVFFKRVVAVAGDRVKFRDKKLFVNGMEQHEPYALRNTEYVDTFRDNFPQQPSWEAMDPSWAATVRAAAGAGEVSLPEGHVFVLGDNRDNSLDSRYFGFVPLRNLVGKPRLVYFSADTDARPALLHPSSIRWGRMFRTL